MKIPDNGNDIFKTKQDDNVPIIGMTQRFDGLITEEKVAAKVAQYRETLERLQLQPDELGMDLEATARFVLEQLGMPKIQQDMEHEKLDFMGMKCQLQVHFPGVNYSIHFNRMAILAISGATFLFNQLVTRAFAAVPEAEPFVMLFTTWCSIEAGMLKIASDNSSNGQARADGIILIPAWLPFPDPDYHFHEDPHDGPDMGASLAVKSWNNSTGLWSKVLGAGGYTFSSMFQPTAIENNGQLLCAYTSGIWVNGPPPPQGGNGNYKTTAIYVAGFTSQGGWSGPQAPTWGMAWNGFTWNAPWETDDGPSLTMYRGKPYLFSRGTHSNYKYRYRLMWSSYDGGWNRAQFFPGGGETDVPPAFAVHGTAMYAFVKGMDSYLYWAITRDGQNWSEWRKNDKMRLSGAPAVTVYGDEVYCVHRGAGSGSRQLWYSVYNVIADTWSPDGLMNDKLASGNPSLTVITEDNRQKVLCISQGADNDSATLWWTRFERASGWSVHSQCGITDAAGSPVLVNFSGQKGPSGPYGLTVIYPHKDMPPPPPPPPPSVALTMNDAMVVARPYTGNAWQSFRLVPQGDGSIGIRDFYNNNLVLTMNDAMVVSRPYTGNTWQSFRLVPQADGSIGIRAFYDNNLVLTMTADMVAPHRYDGHTWQSFRVVEQGDGSKGIRCFY